MKIILRWQTHHKYTYENRAPQMIGKNSKYLSRGFSDYSKYIFCFLAEQNSPHSTVLFTRYANSKPLSSSLQTFLVLLVQFTQKKVKLNIILYSSSQLYHFLWLLRLFSSTPSTLSSSHCFSGANIRVFILTSDEFERHIFLIHQY